PFGNEGLLGPHLLSEAAVAYLQEHEFSCVLWNSIPRDWNDAQGWVDRAERHVRENDHTVMVLHDIEGACVDRLEELIARLRDMDLRFEQAIPAEAMPSQRGRSVSLPDEYVRGRT